MGRVSGRPLRTSKPVTTCFQCGEPGGSLPDAASTLDCQKLHGGRIRRLDVTERGLFRRRLGPRRRVVGVHAVRCDGGSAPMDTFSEPTSTGRAWEMTPGRLRVQGPVTRGSVGDGGASRCGKTKRPEETSPSPPGADRPTLRRGSRRGARWRCALCTGEELAFVRALQGSVPCSAWRRPGRRDVSDAPSSHRAPRAARYDSPTRPIRSDGRPAATVPFGRESSQQKMPVEERVATNRAEVRKSCRGRLAQASDRVRSCSRTAASTAGFSRTTRRHAVTTSERFAL